LLASFGTGFAVMTNASGDQPLVSHGHVLTDPSLFTVGSILYAPSEADDPGYRAAISAAAGGATVDYFDTRVATPTVSQLSLYDCVYTWANYAYADNVTFGNNLATYVDNGGRVVLGVFCTYTTGNFLAGAIMGPGYSPVWSPSGSNHFSLSAYAGNGTTCIHDGVGYYDSFYRDYLTLQGTGAVDGTYGDGEIAHAYRSDYKVIYSNGAGASVLGGAGDWPLLVANACSCPDYTSTEESTWGSVKTLFR
jgi:hypothetical protein